MSISVPRLLAPLAGLLVLVIIAAISLTQWLRGGADDPFSASKEAAWGCGVIDYVGGVHGLDRSNYAEFKDDFFELGVGVMLLRAAGLRDHEYAVIDGTVDQATYGLDDHAAVAAFRKKIASACHDSRRLPSDRTARSDAYVTLGCQLRSRLPSTLPQASDRPKDDALAAESQALDLTGLVATAAGDDYLRTTADIDYDLRMATGSSQKDYVQALHDLDRICAQR